ncbi:MAG: response regulator [Planctomycetaceae bacterium]
MWIPKILFVDDEPNIVRACKRVLRNTDSEVFITTTAGEALELAKEHEFAVVVSDQRMPGMEGTDLLEQIRRIQPDAVRIILTGYADMSAAVDAINRGAVYRFLMKPWDDEQLRSTISHAVAQFALIEENRRLHVLSEAQNEQLRELNEGLERRVAERTSQVIELSGRLDQTLKGALNVLAQLVEISSSTIGNHSRRVADLSLRIGRELSLCDDELRQLEAAALFHDIGKLHLPGAVLRKPRNQLSKEELATLQRHATDGEAIVKAIPFLDDAAAFVRHHHERFDGTGYPDRLSGNTIPLGARIIAVADAFDKQLNEKVTYRDRTVTSVIADVKRRAPEWYDPTIVAVLARCVGDSESAGCELERVLEVNADDLVPGMVLAQDLLTDSGALLLSRDTELSNESLRRLKSMTALSLKCGVKVYRTIQPADQETNVRNRSATVGTLVSGMV